MPDFPEAGSQRKIPRGAWDALMDLGRRQQYDRPEGALGDTPGVGQFGLAGVSPQTVVLVRNGTGAARNVGDLFSLFASPVDWNEDEASRLAFMARPIFTGSSIGATVHILGVAMEPFGVNRIGRVAIHGLVTVLVDFSVAGHQFAITADGVNSKLTSSNWGPVRIIAKATTGTGEIWCLAMLTNQLPGGRRVGTFTAAGSTASDATVLYADATQVNGADGTKGVKFELSSLTDGQIVTIYNNSASALKVYDPTGTGIVGPGFSPFSQAGFTKYMYSQIAYNHWGAVAI